MVKILPRRPRGPTPGETQRQSPPSPPAVDRDRLVWDPEYREELRDLFNDDEAAEPDRAASWPLPDFGL